MRHILTLRKSTKSTEMNVFLDQGICFLGKDTYVFLKIVQNPFHVCIELNFLAKLEKTFWKREFEIIWLLTSYNDICFHRYNAFFQIEWQEMTGNF